MEERKLTWSEVQHKDKICTRTSSPSESTGGLRSQGRQPGGGEPWTGLQGWEGSGQMEQEGQSQPSSAATPVPAAPERRKRSPPTALPLPPPFRLPFPLQFTSFNPTTTTQRDTILPIPERMKLRGRITSPKPTQPGSERRGAGPSLPLSPGSL